KGLDFIGLLTGVETSGMGYEMTSSHSHPTCSMRVFGVFAEHTLFFAKTGEGSRWNDWASVFM
ncbi:MAG: hypothetical protein V1244_07405, partial [Nitrospinaceae bacterium]|nr:hypothetical protein [Nitrospinaceae bacterium]